MTYKLIGMTVGLVFAACVSAHADTTLQRLETAVARPATIQASATRLALASAYKTGSKASAATAHNSKTAHGRGN
jgi:hypothetical protein